MEHCQFLEGTVASEYDARQNGEKIRRLRKERHGWTQVELAQAAGIGAAHLSRIENNRLLPNMFTLYKIADALGVDVYEIIEWEQESS